RRASPASTAVPTPYAAHTLGLPRRSASSSRPGRSSWTSEKLWTSSIASAAGITRSSGAPSACPVASEMTGRTRLPPISTSAYRADSRCPCSSGHSSSASSSASTIAFSCSGSCIRLPPCSLDLRMRLPRQLRDLAEELDGRVRVGRLLEPCALLRHPGEHAVDEPRRVLGRIALRQPDRLGDRHLGGHRIAFELGDANPK